MAIFVIGAAVFLGARGRPGARAEMAPSAAATAVAVVPTAAPSPQLFLPWAALTPTPIPSSSPEIAPSPKPKPSPARTLTPKGSPAPTTKPLARPVVACTRTVNGFTAAAVNAARDAASSGTVCFPAGTYTGNMTASVAGQTWRLDANAKLTGSVNVTGARATIKGGIISLGTGNRWGASIGVGADGVTIVSVDFRGGGTGINVYGRDRTRILRNDFSGLAGSAISLWGESGGADDTLIEGNRIVQTATRKVSPITSRGNEGSTHGGIQNARAIIRGNVIDQGPGDVGWFGLELQQSQGVRLEGNTVKGGHALVSLTQTDRAVVVRNTFDMRGSSYWGVEVANARDATLEHNTFIGGGVVAGDHAVSLNSGSLRTTVRYNRIRATRTLFDVSGDGHVVTDNCLTNVANVFEYRSSGGADITFARNGPC
jgi:parallel beta helix pectate lyase-like protein